MLRYIDVTKYCYIRFRRITDKVTRRKWSTCDSTYCICMTTSLCKGVDFYLEDVALLSQTKHYSDRSVTYSADNFKDEFHEASRSSLA